MRRIAISAVMVFSGCASAKLTGFRDPGYPTKAFARIAVFAAGMTLENAMSVERQICERIGTAACISGKQILPPTRVYSAGEISQALVGARIDGLLMVVLGNDQSTSQYIGTILAASSSSSTSETGTASVTGSRANWQSTSTTTTGQQATAVPVYGYQRTAFATVALFDRVDAKLAWGDELRVSGNGQANVSDAAFVRAATKEVTSQLRAAKLLLEGSAPER
jgi:hypothetical protein